MRQSLMVFFILRRDSLNHKLRYSKTLKADPMGAFLGLVFGLFIGFCCLSATGAGSIDLQDLYLVLVYTLLLFIVFFNSLGTYSFSSVVSSLTLLSSVIASFLP
jgi:hypothetical protein